MENPDQRFRNSSNISLNNKQEEDSILHKTSQESTQAASSSAELTAELTHAAAPYSPEDRDHYVFPRVPQRSLQSGAAEPDSPSASGQMAGQPGHNLGHETAGRGLAGNERIQLAAKASQRYLNYFLNMLGQPYQTVRGISSVHLVHGLVTMFIISLLSALYFVIRLEPLHISFGTTFIKPLFLMALTLAVSAGLTGGLLKLNGTESRAAFTVSRFGALLVPVAACLLLADLSALITLYGLSYLFFMAAILFMILAVNVVLLSHPVSRLAIGRLDGMYSLFIVNAITFYLIYTMLYSTVLSAVQALFGGFMSMF
ncbi:hypothetical protein [Paenibacillus physcomitrellae]|uniref:Uncharacterized protein n=1 Tax=Paenibacillus physcomitrellae TaxID=1619311 RepID=A0ABQ1FQT3_9BACL|nr:hypothetical protein [Paenibacillus physcomitrellae]GGA26985.1 hypothetical protein GCM10010917_09770 [Paenibacillus physcomitrellae]